VPPAIAVEHATAAASAAKGILTLETAERRHVRDVLDRMGRNKRRAAKALGISRSTLDRKMTSR
jgi:transcriptional regulator with PAS, ATPase and Fis domain